MSSKRRQHSNARRHLTYMAEEATLERSLRRALAFAHAALEEARPETARQAVAEALHELARVAPVAFTLDQARQITTLVLRLRAVLAALGAQAEKMA